jgi:purine-binding chemotaxis protein CheW
MAKTQKDEEILQLVTFHVDEEEFGVGILDVREINRMMEITRVPHAPGFVEGVINLRGQVIPVVDLRKRTGQKHAHRGRRAG